MIQHKIRDFCREKGISLAELARESGVPYEALRRWGTRIRQPSAIAVMNVCQILEKKTEELLKEER